VTIRTIAGLVAWGIACVGTAWAQGHPADAAHGAVTHGAPEGVLELPPEARAAVGRLVMQDFQGRMRPVDTLANEVVRKITKSESHEGWAPLDLYLSWLAAAEHWWGEPLLHVRHPGLKELLGVPADASHVSAAKLFGEQGDYLLVGPVDVAIRTPDRDRTKLQRKLLAFDERVNLLYLSLQGEMLRVFPVPDDPEDTWDSGSRVIGKLPEALRPRYQDAQVDLMRGLHEADAVGLMRGVEAIHAIQAEYGASVLPSKAAMESELFLNRTRLFSRVLWPYFFAFLLLMPAYFLSLLPFRERRAKVRHFLFAAGMLLYVAAFIGHLVGYVLRWIASGFAPLSNGFESLLFISLSVALGGILFEWRERRGAASGLSALLAFVVLGISMASLFDPAIGLLVPVLNSNWLIIHVTVITASYGFLGLGSALGALILGLYLLKGPGRTEVRRAILRLDAMLFRVLSWGIALLTVGTLLGGVWANESWGRYWGWDPKETWSLVTIVVYATAQHFRWVPGLNHGWMVAAGSLVGIASIIMTYFGVNYFLTGLHSYAEGSAPEVPTWVYVGSALIVALITASYLARRRRSWDEAPVA
jgi:cytochrome c-type biogenesis protein CcsB